LYNLFWLFKNIKHLRSVAEPLQLQVKGLSSSEPESASLPAKDATEEEQYLSSEDLEDIHIRLGQKGTLTPFLTFALGRPIFTTLLFAVPVVNMLVLLWFGHMSAQLIPETTNFFRKHSKFAGFLVALAYGGLNLFKLLPGPWMLLFLSSALPLALVQTWLNQHWKVVEKENQLARQAFSPLELVAIIIGAALVGLIAISPDVKRF